MMQLLFRRGANIYAYDRYGETPLMLENLTHPCRSQGFRLRRVKSGEYNIRNYKGMDADHLHLFAPVLRQICGSGLVPKFFNEP